MGKGDKKTRRGKIWRGTFGRLRPRPSANKETSKTEVTNEAAKKS